MPINLKVKMCGAKARRNNNNPCRQPGMLTNGRCRLHGGKSTGPKTPEGLLKASQTNLKHGLYTIEAMCEKIQMRMMMKWREDLYGA